ncbi:MAG: beta-propeller domain-containing protein, partial [Myxococcaceae bacterium]
TVYASGESLFIASRHGFEQGMGWFWEGGTAQDEATTIHKFALVSDPPSSSYAGSGVVKGHVLNQFSMDEHDGYLRIATSNGRVPSPNVSSVVTVLSQAAEGLEEVGRVDNIAPNEDIRSVRFEGTKGFMVTFKKTDPLFALDLSVPEKPRIAGALKIPGFSTYLHMMDATHLLSVGFDAEDHGGFAYFQGLQLQVFDVSDLTNPTLAHKTVIGTRGSTSEAATNHLAFNYFNGMLALPMVVCQGTEGGSSFGNLTFGGLMVYDVTAAGGFSYRGGVSHDPPETEGAYRNACSSWWSSGSTAVKRSVFMDEYVYSIAEDVIRVDRLDSLGIDVAVLPLK